MVNYKFTVFTPCYNAGKTIARVFRSVEGQTYTNFEWIIINDGSRDNSDEVIRRLIENSSVKKKIRYTVQRNLGKHRAWNCAAEMASGELFLCADADDEFVPETLAFYNEKANEIGLVGSSEFCGINACAFDHATGKIVGTEFPEDGLVCDNFEMAYRYNVRGDKWMCNRTDFMKASRFPEIDAPFVPETRLWYKFALDGYKIKCYNKYLMAHYVEQSSLCNSIWFKFNVKAARSKLIYHFWLLRHAGFKIFKMNFCQGLRLVFVITLKNLVMYLGGYVVAPIRKFRNGKV